MLDQYSLPLNVNGISESENKIKVIKQTLVVVKKMFWYCAYKGRCKLFVCRVA